MNFCKDVVSILKEFEQNDYRNGDKSIPPESYEAIANKIYSDLHDKYWFQCVEHHCHDNDVVIRYIMKDKKIDEVWVKVEGESGWTVFGYDSFISGVERSNLIHGANGCEYVEWNTSKLVTHDCEL